MSVFSSLYTSALDHLTSLTGDEGAVYTLNEGGTTDCTVIAGRTLVTKVLKSNGNLVKLWRREFTLRRSEIADPKVKDKINFEERDWPITGFVSQTNVYTRVVCEIEEERTHGREGLRK